MQSIARASPWLDAQRGEQDASSAPLGAGLPPEQGKRTKNSGAERNSNLRPGACGRSNKQWEPSQAPEGREPGASDTRFSTACQGTQAACVLVRNILRAVMAGRTRRREARHTSQDDPSRWTSSLHPSPHMLCSVEYTRPHAITRYEHEPQERRIFLISALQEHRATGPEVL